jgi:hypothetical protein
METDRWVWCKHCEQCYQLDWESNSDGSNDSKSCPYNECYNQAGDTLEWKRVRRLHPEFPKLPTLATRYHVSGWLWCEVCERCFKFDVDGEHCPYDNCNSTQIKRAWPWWRIQMQHNNYPVVPERGQRFAHEHKAAKQASAKRRKHVSQNCFRVENDEPTAREVVCISCRTINPKFRNRCFYCEELLPGSKKIGSALRLGLSWNHPSGLPVVFRG